MTVIFSCPSPLRYLMTALTVIMCTIALSAASILVTNRYSTELSRILYEVFWVGQEANVPTFVNFALLAIAAALLLIVALQSFEASAKWRWHWLCFGLLLVLMSFDEAARVHENVGPYLSPEIEIFYLNWVVVAIPFVLVLVFLGFNFIRNMDSTTRQLILIAMAFYLGGALGLEMLSFYLAHNDLGHARLATLMEETFEMIGAALFGTAALHQIRLMHTTYTA